MKHDLRHFIQNDRPPTLTWKKLNSLFLDISTALNQIHKEGLVHKDLHSGNVLQRPDSVWVIGDLGLCGPPKKLETHLYGCIPYIAPEVLSSSDTFLYTPASDVYSFGMLMCEAVVGQISFGKVYHDPEKLAIDICNGRRPKVPANLPNDFTLLMKQCLKANPSERPTTTALYNFFWKKCISSENEDGLVSRSSLRPMPSNDILVNQSGLYRFQHLPQPKDIIKGTLFIMCLSIQNCHDCNSLLF